MHSLEFPSLASDPSSASSCQEQCRIEVRFFSRIDQGRSTKQLIIWENGCAKGFSATMVQRCLSGGLTPLRWPKVLVACEDSVGLGDQIDMVLDHFKTDHGIGARVYDGLSSRKTRRRTVRILLKTKISAGINRLHDDSAIFETNQQNRVVRRDRRKNFTCAQVIWFDGWRYYACRTTGSKQAGQSQYR